MQSDTEITLKKSRATPPHAKRTLRRRTTTRKLQKAARAAGLERAPQDLPPQKNFVARTLRKQIAPADVRLQLTEPVASGACGARGVDKPEGI